MLLTSETRPLPPTPMPQPEERPRNKKMKPAPEQTALPTNGDHGDSPSGFAINVSGVIKGKMGDTANSDDNTSAAADDELLELDLSRMNDTDYQQYQTNQDRLKKFKRKLKTPNPYPAPYRGLDWFNIVGLGLGLVVAGFLLLVLLIMFRDPIVRRMPQAEELYNWLSYFLNYFLKKIGA